MTMKPSSQYIDRQRIEDYLANEDPLKDTPRTKTVKYFLAQNPKDLYDRRQMSGHITASLLVLSPDEQNVLVIEHQHLKTTLHPGGHIDFPDDSFTTAFKECSEETGLTAKYIKPWLRWPMHAIFDIDSHYIPENLLKNEGEHFHHDLTYIAQSSTWDLPPVFDQGVKNPHWLSLEEFVHTSRRAKELYDKIVFLKVTV